MEESNVRTGLPIMANNDAEETSSMLARSPSIQESKNSKPGATISLRPANENPAENYFRLWCIYFLILSSVVVPLAILIWWIIDAIKNQPGMLDASIIGGRLSNIQAKAVDFVCGALLAPLLMLVLDYLWFSNARVFAVNERRKSTTVPLSSLVEVSNTSGGGFDLPKLHALLKGKTWRLYLLTLLVLLSGVAGKMLSNFIAYEAFNTDVPASKPATLRMLKDTYIDSLQYEMLSEEGSGSLSESSFSTSQQSDIANQMAALLTGLNFENATTKLDAGSAYIGTNATATSLNALDSTVVGLTNVPGYRLSVDCQPGQPTEFGVVQMGETYYQFTVMFECPTTASTSCGAIYYARIPGIESIGSSTSDNDEYQYAAFLSNNTYVYLGYLDSFNETNIIASSFGEVYPTAFNMTPYRFESTKSIMTTWGISCSILRQEGLLNYTRQSGKTWTISDSSFSNEKNVTKSFLADWQTMLNYQAPISTIPGIGPALARTAGSAEDGTLSWTIFARNYLYASGEAQRISYEVAAQNSTNQTQYFYNVGATTTVQHYRITYIPLLLLLGLLGVIGAAIITCAMAFYSKDTHSTKVDRKVNSLRLLVDSVAGLQESAPIMAAAGTFNNAELEKWAAKYQVGYSEVVEGGDLVIRLFRS